MAELKRLFVEDGARPAVVEQVQPRPKVLRRPPQFSPHPAVAKKPPPVIPSLPFLPIPVLPQAVSWQEDGRFGVLLVLCLLLVNGLLALSLTWLKPARFDTHQASVGAYFGQSALPSAFASAPRDRATIYRDPHTQNQLSERLDLKQLDADRNGLSVSPQQIPVPKARRFTQEQ